MYVCMYNSLVGTLFPFLTPPISKGKALGDGRLLVITGEQGQEGGGGGVPEVQPLTFLHNIFHEKGTPFVYLLLRNGTSFI